MRKHTRSPLILLLLCAMGMSQALSPVWASLRPDADVAALAIGSHGLSSASIERVVIRPGDDDETTLQDSTISNWAPDTIHGDAPQVKIRPGDNTEIMNALLRWNLDLVPSGSWVQSAYLEMYCTQGSGSQIDMSIFEILRPWQEASATWKTAYSGVSWNTPGCQAPGIDRAAIAGAIATLQPSTGWLSWDITDLVQGWVDDPSTNYGMILVPTQFRPKTEYAFASSEAYFSVRPRLAIEYGPSVATRTPTPSPTSDATSTPSPTASLTPTLTPTPSRTMPIKGDIHGLVYEDQNESGEYDEGEPGLGGVLVTLKDSDGRQVDFRNTGADGDFFFGALPPGTYRVEQYDLPGTHSTTPNLIYIPLAAGDLLWVSFGDRYTITPTPTVATEDLFYNYLPLCSRNLVYASDGILDTVLVPQSARHSPVINAIRIQRIRTLP
jgi:hypothetical protein